MGGSLLPYSPPQSHLLCSKLVPGPVESQRVRGFSGWSQGVVPWAYAALPSLPDSLGSAITVRAASKQVAVTDFDGRTHRDIFNSSAGPAGLCFPGVRLGEHPPQTQRLFEPRRITPTHLRRGQHDTAVASSDFIVRSRGIPRALPPMRHATSASNARSGETLRLII